MFDGELGVGGDGFNDLYRADGHAGDLGDQVDHVERVVVFVGLVVGVVDDSGGLVGRPPRSEYDGASRNDTITWANDDMPKILHYRA